MFSMERETLRSSLDETLDLFQIDSLQCSKVRPALQACTTLTHGCLVSCEAVLNCKKYSHPQIIQELQNET